MFRNAGVKLKVLAKVMFFVIWGGIAIVLPIMAEEGAFLLLSVPLGFLVGWLSTLLTYAFGELCENVYEINERQRRNAAEQPVSRSLFSSSPAPEPSPISTDNDTVKCPSCGKPTATDSKYCLHCGEMIH
ncbi:MAG: hypothetical protein IKO47_00840 [Ruminococcus sp.]|nr:hypothetical protein [Ruminococcus sp.]